MLSSQTILLAVLVTAVSARPAVTEKRWFGGYFWASPSRTSSYIDFGKRVPGPNANAPACDLSNAVMPTAPTPLPSPAAGLALTHVAIGRGTQNYTCDLLNVTATPVAVGAVASLFNVTCIAADSPDLLAKLTPIALDLPVPTSSDQSSPMNQDLSGHHYFTDAKTPVFNLDTQLHQYGAGSFKKGNSSNAPTNAPLGQFGHGDGSVAWLKLDAKDSQGQIFQEVYRLNTAGGQSPKTCTGMPAAFEVQYSAEYWILS